MPVISLSGQPVHPGRKEALVRRAQRVQRYGAAVGQCQILPAGCADAHRRHARAPRRLRSSAAAIGDRQQVAAPGPRRTRRRGRGRRAGRVSRPAPTSPASAISATATSTPPSETSWQARTPPARICAADEVAVARARPPGRPAAAAPSSRPATSRSHSDWPSQPLVAPISTRSSHGAQRDARPPARRPPARRGRRSPGWAGCRGPRSRCRG